MPASTEAGFISQRLSPDAPKAPCTQGGMGLKPACTAAAEDPALRRCTAARRTRLPAARQPCLSPGPPGRQTRFLA